MFLRLANLIFRQKNSKMILENLNLLQAVENVSRERPFIQSQEQLQAGIKLKPIEGLTRCEVYFKEILIDDNYQFKKYDVAQLWSVVP